MTFNAIHKILLRRFTRFKSTYLLNSSEIFFHVAFLFLVKIFFNFNGKLSSLKWRRRYDKLAPILFELRKKTRNFAFIPFIHSLTAVSKKKCSRNFNLSTNSSQLKEHSCRSLLVRWFSFSLSTKRTALHCTENDTRICLIIKLCGFLFFRKKNERKKKLFCILLSHLIALVEFGKKKLIERIFN